MPVPTREMPVPTKPFTSQQPSSHPLFPPLLRSPFFAPSPPPPSSPSPPRTIPPPHAQLLRVYDDGHVEFVRFVWAKCDMHEKVKVGYPKDLPETLTLSLNPSLNLT